jgi:actin-related protein 6
MPRLPKTAPSKLNPDHGTLVIDNGGYTIKAGLVGSNNDENEGQVPEPSCHIVPNCIARGRDKRIWVASQLDKCNDFGEMAFRRPFERGHIVNWESQKEIWDHTFLSKHAVVKVRCFQSS